MKTKILLLLSCLFIIAANAQQPPGLPGVGTSISNLVSQIDESTNLFTRGEIEFRLGGVYSQQTGEAGALLAVEKWDIGKTNFGIGLEMVNSANKRAAEFAYGAYRKCLGNVAASVFVGAGYDEINKALMGVAGARLEYRQSKHLGAFTSFGYGFETKKANDRGLLVAAGVTYNF